MDIQTIKCFEEDTGTGLGCVIGAHILETDVEGDPACSGGSCS